MRKRTLGAICIICLIIYVIIASVVSINAYNTISINPPPAIVSIDCVTTDEFCIISVNLIKWEKIPNGINVMCVNDYEYIVTATNSIIQVLPIIEKREYKRCSTKEDRRAEKSIQ